MSNFAVVKHNNFALVKIKIQVLENSDVGRWEMMRVLFFRVFVCFCFLMRGATVRGEAPWKFGCGY
jgi:hypothetical protein